MDKEEREIESISGSIKEALAFAHYPSIWVYNVLATFIICATIYLFTYERVNRGVSMDFSDAIMSVTQQGPSPLLVLSIVCFIILLVVTFKNVAIFSRVAIYSIVTAVLFIASYAYLYIYQKSHLGKDSGMESVTGLFQKLIANDSGTQLAQSDFQSGLTILIIASVVCVLNALKDVGVVAQVAEEDYGRPNWGIGYYISFKTLGKYLLVVLLGFVLLAFFVWLTTLVATVIFGANQWVQSLVSVLVMVEIMGFAIFYPAVILTLIRTTDFFKSLSLRENSRTINYFVGQGNYMILAGLLLNIIMLSFLFSLVIEAFGFNVITFVLTGIVCYVVLYFFSALHYLIGLLSGYNDMQEDEAEVNEYDLDFPEFIDDVKYCVKNGYPNDAIELLNNIIDAKSEKPEAILTMYKFMIDTYKGMQEPEKVNKTRQEMIDYADRDAPHLKKKVMPIMVDLFLEGEFKPETSEIRSLAEAAYKTKRYEAVPKLVSGFSDWNSGHEDVFYNYFWLARSWEAMGDHTRAFRRMRWLIKNFPSHPQIIDVRSECLALKSKVDVSALPKSKLAKS